MSVISRATINFFRDFCFEDYMYQSICFVGIGIATHGHLHQLNQITNKDPSRLGSAVTVLGVAMLTYGTYALVNTVNKIKRLGALCMFTGMNCFYAGDLYRHHANQENPKDFSVLGIFFMGIGAFTWKFGYNLLNHNQAS